MKFIDERADCGNADTVDISDSINVTREIQ